MPVIPLLVSGLYSKIMPDKKTKSKNKQKRRGERQHQWVTCMCYFDCTVGSHDNWPDDRHISQNPPIQYMTDGCMVYTQTDVFHSGGGVPSPAICYDSHACMHNIHIFSLRLFHDLWQWVIRVSPICRHLAVEFGLWPWGYFEKIYSSSFGSELRKKKGKTKNSMVKKHLS